MGTSVFRISPRTPQPAYPRDRLTELSSIRAPARSLCATDRPRGASSCRRCSTGLLLTALEPPRPLVSRELGIGEARTDAPGSGAKEGGGGASVHAPQAAGAASHVDLIAYLTRACVMVCQRCVSVPHVHDRVCSLRLPPSRGARPCCGRHLEGSRLEARDPRRLSRSLLSHGTVGSSSLSSDRYLKDGFKAEQQW